MTPKIEKKRDLAEWSVAEVGEWLEWISLSHLVAKFQEEKVDGPTLLSLTDVGLRRDLGLKLGEIVKLFAEREKLAPKETGLLFFLVSGSLGSWLWLVLAAGEICEIVPSLSTAEVSLNQNHGWFVFSLFFFGWLVLVLVVGCGLVLAELATDWRLEREI